MDTERVQPDSLEHQLQFNINKLTLLLKENSSDKFKDHIIKDLGYVALLGLLDKVEDISYPTLQFINQICENSPKH